MTEEEIDLELNSIFDELLEFYEPAEAMRWMFRPHPQLGGRTAFSLIRDGRGYAVRAIIDRLKSGAYL